MLPLVEFPELVQHYTPFFKNVFSPEALIEFERYISGLIVSENKTVDGINRLFVVESRNQSSLNRLLTKSPFSLADLNQSRLDLLASLPGTQMKPKGYSVLTTRCSRISVRTSSRLPSCTIMSRALLFGHTIWSPCTTAMTRPITR